MNEIDYDDHRGGGDGNRARGRWFLGGVRPAQSHWSETRQLLDAMAPDRERPWRLGQPSPPWRSADPSVRLLIQRIKESGERSSSTVCGRHARGRRGPDYLVAESVDLQARAVSGMMRGPGRSALPSKPEAARLAAARGFDDPADAATASVAADAMPRMTPGPIFHRCWHRRLRPRRLPAVARKAAGLEDDSAPRRPVRVRRHVPGQQAVPLYLTRRRSLPARAACPALCRHDIGEELLRRVGPR